jgi:hypothetical protein
MNAELLDNIKQLNCQILTLKNVVSDIVEKLQNSDNVDIIANIPDNLIDIFNKARLSLGQITNKQSI